MILKCPVADRCGGCDYIGMEYEKQLELKREKIRALFPHHPVEPVKGMTDPSHYRHKVYATFGYSRSGHLRAGMYEENSHRLVYGSDCRIQNETANHILDKICEIAGNMRIQAYDEKKRTGVLRHAYIRVAASTGEVMLVIVIGSRELPGSKVFLKRLLEVCPELTTVILNWNDTRTSMILGKREQVLYGPGYIHDVLLGNTYRISSRSFYQVNPAQTEVLYRTAIELAGIRSDTTVLDACCGIGTISLSAAPKAKQVIGVEIVPEAIKDAIYNARHNRIGNVRFYCDDIEHYLIGMNEKPDVVILDPPRSGMSLAAMKALEKAGPDKIVYISCNPETQARDIRQISRTYRIGKIVPVDMFCQTEHVETICFLYHQK